MSQSTKRKPLAPQCGHSRCSQWYIDTGDTDCVESENAESELLLGEIQTLILSVAWGEVPRGEYRSRLEGIYSRYPEASKILERVR